MPNTYGQFGNNVFGLADIREKIFSPVFMRIYNNPRRSLIDPSDHPEDPGLKYDSWVSWFWRKRRAFVLDKKVDLAIELVEAYDPNRVLGGIAIALTIYFALTITWLALGGDPGYVAGVMSFVLSILAGKWCWSLSSRSLQCEVWERLTLSNSLGWIDWVVRLARSRTYGWW